MSRFLEHHRKGRAGARTEVEAVAARGNQRADRIKEAAKETAVAFVPWRVLVQIVFGFFGGGREMVFRWHEDELARSTAVIFAMLIYIEFRYVVSRAERAEDMSLPMRTRACLGFQSGCLLILMHEL